MKRPTAAQRKWLQILENAPMARFYRPAAWATIKACEVAGWTKVDGHGNARLTDLGRAALRRE
jgi:hypothetical protein